MHAYGAHVFDGHLERMRRWAEAFEQPVLCSEAGLAAKDLVSVKPEPANYARSEMLKAERWAVFVHQAPVLCPQLVGIVRFIDRGSLQEWGSLERVREYEARGTNSYWLGDAALACVGQLIRGA